MCIKKSNPSELITDIEGGNIEHVQKVSQCHFKIQMRRDNPSVYQYPGHHGYWFYFKLENVKNQHVRIDITNCHWMWTHWRHYKPVFTYANDPDQLTGVEWHRIERTKIGWKSFTFEQLFAEDHAWVALRYPYTYSRHINYIESIRCSPFVNIEVLGNTLLGNAVNLVKVTENKIPEENKKVVVVYAREHGVEQDGSWVIEGMIDFLLTSNTMATIVRENVVFMFMPIIAPDSVTKGRTVDPTTGSDPGLEFAHDKINSIEATYLYNRVKRLVAAGNSLDIIISLHNPHGSEPNIYSYLRPCGDKIVLNKCKQLHKSVLSCARATGYTTGKTIIAKSCSYSVGRFAKDFGSLSMIYEVNHQAKKNYLSLEKLKGIGVVLLKGIADHYGVSY